MTSAKIAKEVGKEVTDILADLIRIDTTYPPGNETEAAEYVSECLHQDGFECILRESASGRGNVTTRLHGSGGKPSVLFLSHLDVVAANATEWSVDPFGGVVKDGFVWGRGALDMKGMTAIELMALKLLKREGAKLRGDIVLAATADEEQGGLAGAAWMMQNYPEEIMADYVFNEGGGLGVAADNRYVFTVNTAEKGLLWLRVRAKGFPAHGATPNFGDNAILRMSQVIQRLERYRPPILLIPTVKQFLENMAREDPSLREPFSRLLSNPEYADAILDELAETENMLAEELRPRLRMTVTPTMIRGGSKENIVPSDCEAVFDCRVLPGQTVAEAHVLIQRLLSDIGLEKMTFEVIYEAEGSESPVETPLMHTITEVLHEFEPNCGVTPVLMTGGTDSRFFRAKGSVAYGFQPMRPEKSDTNMVVKREHGVDERISVDNLVFGTNVLYETVKRFLT